MIKVVVFDFDGTLVDSNSIKMLAFDQVVAPFPRGGEVLSAARQAGGDRYRILSRVASEIAGEASPSDVAALANRLTADYGGRCRLGIASACERRGATKVLNELRRRGFHLYVNSATPQVDIPPLLRLRGWLSIFHGVYGGPLDKVENLRRILRRERARPRTLMMVGDSTDDQLAAKHVGSWFVGIVNEQRITLRPPFGMCDLVKLPPLIQRLTGRPLHASTVRRP